MAKDNIWIRHVMDETTSKFIGSLATETLDVLEVSGSVWADMFSWKSYRSSHYPDFDICHQPFDQQYDLIIAEQVFEHIRYPALAARNIYNGLRPGGHALITVPCIFHIHPTPLDGWRWTPQGLGFLLEDAGFNSTDIVVDGWGNRECLIQHSVTDTTTAPALDCTMSLRNEPHLPIMVWGYASKATNVALPRPETTCKFKYSIVACARWEEEDIVEWVEYHRSIGFDHIYLYSNDDDPAVLYRRLLPYIGGSNPFVTYLFWPIPGQQIEIMYHFLSTFSSQCEWALALDIDEFLVLRNVNDIHKFMAPYENDFDCVYFNWLPFGNAGRLHREPESILLSRVRRAPNLDVHTKNIYRTKCITADIARAGLQAVGQSFIHFWDGYAIDGFRIGNVLGDDVGSYSLNFPQVADRVLADQDYQRRVMEKAFIAHFQFKSEDDFVRRARRGGFTAQKHWQTVYDDGSYRGLLAHYNLIEENYLAEYWQSYLTPAIAPAIEPALEPKEGAMEGSG